VIFCKALIDKCPNALKLVGLILMIASLALSEIGNRFNSSRIPSSAFCVVRT